MSSNLYDAGYHEITNIDFSPIVINEMKKKNTKRLKMKWEVMDMLQMKYGFSTLLNLVFLCLYEHSPTSLSFPFPLHPS